MSPTSLDVLSVPRAALAAEVAPLHGKPGKGAYHADALFRALHRDGTFNPGAMPEFADNPALAARVGERFRLDLPEIAARQGDGDTFKILLKLRDGLECESVVIPMKQYKTLCVSSQVGCKMGCRFCETAQMGFLRNLTAGEIVAQVFIARHVLGEPVENIVFMGMGEPTDNLDAVIDAIRVITDPRGYAIPPRAITLSTVGNVPGIDRLAGLAKIPLTEGGLRGLRLAVSLNAPDDSVRGDIMPVNGAWDMAALKDALKRWPFARRDDFIFVEYVLIADVNDGPGHARLLADWLRDLNACVNLIPYNPRRESPYARPSGERVNAFFLEMQELGQRCRIRGTKGDGAMAACGQLGNRALSKRGRRRNPPVKEVA